MKKSTKTPFIPRQALQDLAIIQQARIMAGARFETQLGMTTEAVSADIAIQRDILLKLLG